MKKNGFAPILILIIVAIVLGAGYYFLKQNKSTLTPLASPEPTAKVGDPTADWKTYINSKLGFSIQYPQDWVIITDSDRSVGWSTFIADNKDRLIATKSFQVNIEYSNVFELPFSGGEKVNITKDNLGYYAYQGNTPATSIFQGRPVIKSLVSSPLSGAHTELRILDGKRLVEIKVDTKDDKEVALHDQILSTFKFLNESSKGICRANFEVASSLELSAEQDLSLSCSSKQNQTDCEAMGDSYNKNLKDFSTPDGIADCIWI